MSIDMGSFANYLNANVFIDFYNQFLAYFPSYTHWLVSLIILGVVVFVFYRLITSNLLFIILVIILMPALWPVLKNFSMEVYSFGLYLWEMARTGLPIGS